MSSRSTTGHGMYSVRLLAKPACQAGVQVERPAPGSLTCGAMSSFRTPTGIANSMSRPAGPGLCNRDSAQRRYRTSLFPRSRLSRSMSSGLSPRRTPPAMQGSPNACRSSRSTRGHGWVSRLRRASNRAGSWSTKSWRSTPSMPSKNWLLKELVCPSCRSAFSHLAFRTSWRAFHSAVQSKGGRLRWSDGLRAARCQSNKPYWMCWLRPHNGQMPNVGGPS